AAALEHVRDRETGELDRRGDVEMERPLHVLRARIHERRRYRAAGIVDEDVDAAELGDRSLYGRWQSFQIHHVGRHDQRAPAATCSRSATVRASSATSAPASAYASAISAPIPFPAPVTMATLSVKRNRSSTDMLPPQLALDELWLILLHGARHA